MPHVGGLVRNARHSARDLPDELLADIMALETWRGHVETRNVNTAKKRKAAPAVASVAAAP